jgi:hypothetical protein
MPPIAILLLLEILFSLLLLYSPGTGDVSSFWIPWTRKVVANGLVEGYRLGRSAYPPLSHVLMFVVATVSEAYSVTLFVGLKLSLAAALLVNTVIVYRWTRTVALAGLLGFSFFFNGVALGYLDMYFAPALVLSLWALQQRRIGLFSGLFALACLIKWQPLIIAPFLGLHAVSVAAARGDGIAKRWGFATVPGAAVVLVTAAAFRVETIWSAFSRSLNEGYLSGTALNLGWIVTYYLRAYHPHLYGGLTDGLVTLVDVEPTLPWVVMMKLTFAAFYLAALWRFTTKTASFPHVIECSLVGYLGYCLLNTGVHENHLFIATILSVIAASLSADKTWRAVVIVAMSILNLVTFYGFTGTELPFSRVIGIDVSVVFAAVNVLVFLATWAQVVLPTQAAFTEHYVYGGRDEHSLTSGVAGAMREKRNWPYFAYIAAALWGLDGSALVIALLLPLVTWVAASIGRSARWQKRVVGLLGGVALLRVAAGGSRSAQAVYDPLFWGVVAVAAITVAALARRHRTSVLILATFAGGCVAIAIVLPSVNIEMGFETRNPLRSLTEQIGVPMTVTLLAVWLQAIWVRGSAVFNWIDAAIRGALCAGVLVAVAGPTGTANNIVGLVVGVSVLLGVAEARARRAEAIPALSR